MLKYAHIGYPKAASTWLQVFLFPCHPLLYHFGRHNGDDIVDDDLRIALWNDLITRPPFLYDPREVAHTFDRVFAQAAETDAVACGISQEILTLSLVGTVDITERARRLHAAMGADTRIIIVVRNQLDWIRSLFCGLIKEGGMTLDLDEFLFYFYYQQSQSPFYTLFYDHIYRLYAELFGESNVHVVPYELITRDVREFAAQICTAIGVPLTIEVPERRINERPSPSALTVCLDYNRRNPFYFGSHHFRRPLAYAAAPVFRKRFGIEPPSWAEEERERSAFAVERIEPLVQQAEREGKVIPPMDLTFPARYQGLLAKAYAPHNKRFGKLTGIDLTDFGYPV